MKKRFSINDMSVRKKIIAFSLVIISFMLVISVIGFWCSTKINTKRQDNYQNYALSNYYLSKALGSFKNIETAALKVMYIVPKNPDADASVLKADKDFQDGVKSTKTEVNNCAKAVNEYLADVETRAKNLNKDIQTQLESVKKLMVDFGNDADNALGLLAEGQLAAVKENFSKVGGQIMADVDEQLTKLIKDIDALMEVHNKEIQKEMNMMLTILVAASVVSVIFTLFFCLALSKAISMPIRKLSDAAKKLAIGDVDVDCTKLSNDDLGELMDNFASMVDSIKEQVRLADTMAKGDFTIEVKPRSDKDVLGKALHKLIADENLTLSNIKEAGSQITMGAEQVANASQALAQGSTQQASALEEVTASMDEVTQRIKNNATEAGEANVLVNNIKEMASEGNVQMQSMIQAMDSINESSETISKIISTIDSIAFQTNILALNAAVEAARAGVHGKGFAVVAEEVRNLAAKSASAASETAEMIEDSIRKIANGTKIAEATAKSLDAIVKSIDEIVGLISSIAISSNDQSTAISQIDQAISQVSTVVQTNAATSEQCAAASEELSNQAVTLKNLIGQYKLLTGMAMQSSGYMESSPMSYGGGESIISLDGDMGKY